MVGRGLYAQVGEGEEKYPHVSEGEEGGDYVIKLAKVRREVTIYSS